MSLRDKPATLPPEVKQKLTEIEALQQQQEQQQGLGRPIISEKIGDYRVLAVGGILFWSNRWQTFHDFLFQYIKSTLGPRWGNSELAKPASERHPLLNWYQQATIYINSHITEPGQVHRAEGVGVVSAYLGLAYGLYLVAHNARLHSRLLRRLRKADQFLATYYEAIVFGALIRAGFALKFEDETDGTTTHCELVATAPGSGKKFSVEAKMRQEGTASQDLGRQLKKALAKRADYPRIVFLEANLPDTGPERRHAVAEQIARDLKRREPERFSSDDALPPAYVIVTNHPYLYSLDKPTVSWAFAVGFRLPDFGWGTKFPRLRDMINARRDHIEVWNFMKSVERHNTVPMTFDGEIPEFAFGRGEKRFVIGRQYRVPNGRGGEVTATLKSAQVIEQDKLMWGIFESQEGSNLVASCALTDDELAGYRRHPQTFFGAVQPPNRIDDPLDLYDWFYERYQSTSRENILNQLSGAPDYDELRRLPLQSLVETYCEEWWNRHLPSRESP